MTVACRDSSLCCQEFHFCSNDGKLCTSNEDILQLIKVCGKEKNLGTHINSDIVARGIYLKDARITTALITMYARCGCLAEARQVFDAITIPDVVSWTALIASYVHNELAIKALKCYEVMLVEGCSPNAITFAYVLKACTVIGCAYQGEKVHVEIIQRGLLEENTVLGNALVDMYAKCGMIGEAQKVFDELPVRYVVSRTSLITGYFRTRLNEKALDCFSQMLQEGISADAITFTCACGSMRSCEEGAKVHAEIKELEPLDKDVMLGIAVVDMCAKCGAFLEAWKAFEQLPVHGIISWNALIAGYVQYGLVDEALNCYNAIQNEGISPDAVTFSHIFKACGTMASPEKGEEIHGVVCKLGFVDKDDVLCTVLVDMYVKCGAVLEAQDVLNKHSLQDIVSCNAMVGGYSQLGLDQSVCTLFANMIAEDNVPDAVTFVILLTACSHAGLVEEGQVYFDKTKDAYCLPLYLTLVGALRKWMNIELGTLAFEYLSQLDENHPAAYFCISDIYAGAGV